MTLRANAKAQTHLIIGCVLRAHGLNDVVEMIMADGLSKGEMPIHTLALYLTALSLGSAAARA